METAYRSPRRASSGHVASARLMVERWRRWREWPSHPPELFPCHTTHCRRDRPRWSPPLRRRQPPPCRSQSPSSRARAVEWPPTAMARHIMFTFDQHTFLSTISLSFTLYNFPQLPEPLNFWFIFTWYSSYLIICAHARLEHTSATGHTNLYQT